MSFLPAIGARVRVVESPKTTNWTRLDVGRTGEVVGHSTHSFRTEHGPRVLLQVRFDTVERWDGTARHLPVHLSPCQAQALAAGRHDPAG